MERTEINRKISQALLGKNFLTNETRKKQALKQSETKMRCLLEADFDTLSPERKRRRVFIEQEKRCLLCGLSEWMGRPIGLQLDHEDGDETNNSRSNLRGLCPNCHSQTVTYCGRNRRGKPDHKVSDRVLQDALLSTSSISQALAKVGVFQRNGHWYDRCRKLRGVEA